MPNNKSKVYKVLRSHIKVGFVGVTVFTILVGLGSSHLIVKMMRNSNIDQTAKVAQLVEKEIEKVFDTLSTIAYIEELDENGIDIKEKAIELNQKIKKEGLIRVGVADQRGNAYEDEGHVVDISNETYFLEALKGEKIFVTQELSRRDGQQYTVFSTPLIVEGEMSGVIYAVYEENYLQSLLNNFKEQEHTLLIVDDHKVLAVVNHGGVDIVKYKTIHEVFNDYRLDNEGEFLTKVKGKNIYATYQMLNYPKATVIRGVPLVNMVKEGVLLILLIWSSLVVMYVILWRKYKDDKRNKSIKLEQIEESKNLMVTRIDDKGNIVYMNGYMRKRLSIESGELSDKTIFSILMITDHKKLEDILKERQNKMRKESIDLSFVTEKYKKVYTICTIKWDMQNDYNSNHIVEISAIDISEYCLSEKDKEQINSLYQELASSEEEGQRRFEELHEKQEALKQSEERYSLVVDTASMGIWDYDYRNKCFFASPKVKNITGVGEEQLNKEMLKKIIHPEDYKQLKEVNEKCKKGIQDSYEIECRILHKERDYIWVYIIGKWVRNSNGEITRIAGSVTDIHDKKQQEEKIKYIAYYDDLTGMTNKNYLKELFERYKNENEHIVLIHLDVDNFKFINDSYGHEYGDLALVQISKRLSELQQVDTRISRIGADEFVVLLSQVEGEEQVKLFISKIKNEFKESIYVNEVKFTVSFSAGIAVYPKDGMTFEALMTSADTAMHKAKEKGKRKEVFFDSRFKEVFMEKIHIENDLRKAILNNEFVLFYQPQVQVNTGAMKGFEALIRWIKPTGEMVPPFRFIGIAEETGLMVPIGAWVIKEACLFINRLKEAGYSNLYVAVNISVVQLIQDDFVNTVEAILDETQVDATKLHIEITETMLMESIDININKLNKIKERGVVISLDDFGKGYSSLTYLKQLPINVLKIEKAFIDDILEGSKKNITGAIINLGHELALEVVAEGVEEESQFEYLKNYNCDMIQGYLISKPIPEKEVYNFIHNIESMMEVRKNRNLKNN